MMGKGVMLVWSNPESPGKEAEYNRWYNEIHIPELTENGLCRRVTRYKVSDDTQMPGAAGSPYRYLAVYEFDDLAAGIAGLGRRAKPSTPGPIDPNMRRALFDGVFEFSQA
jgi:hypothetical protein